VRLKVSYLPALRMPLVRPACRPFPPPTPACRGQDAAEKETRCCTQRDIKNLGYLPSDIRFRATSTLPIKICLCFLLAVPGAKQ